LLLDALVSRARRAGEKVVHASATIGLTLRNHPLALLRPLLEAWRPSTPEELADAKVIDSHYARAD
jgi:hypothetical protein